nr:hypothetical protein [Bacillus pumilus]
MTTVKDAAEQDALAAYVITAEETTDLKESLKRTLPDYMVPSWIIKLDQLPMTANGKVDLKALPQDLIWKRTKQHTKRQETKSKRFYAAFGKTCLASAKSAFMITSSSLAETRLKAFKWQAGSHKRAGRLI